jgi:hypothetical protein
MKLRWVMMASLTLAGRDAVAQQRSPHIGAFGGMNQSHVAGTGSDIANHSGAAAGAYVGLPFATNWSFQTGVTWTQKGWERSDPQDLNVVKLDYLAVPLLLRYDFAQHERVGGLVYFGPALASRSGCSLSSTSHSTGATVAASCDEVERQSSGSVAFNSFDVGAVVGAGGRFSAGRVNMIAAAQYDFGVKKIANSGDNKNRTATFSLGLEAPIGRR